jgi:hypothetical protein
MFKARLLALASIAVAGCTGSGGDGGGGSCTMPAPCGGDVVATWNVADICLDDASAFAQQGVDDPACEDSFSDIEIDASGTMSFTADGMVNTNVSLAISMHVVWTKACLMALNPEVAELEIGSACTMLMTSSQMSAEIASASCSVVGANCECDVELPARAMTSSGTYTLAGNQIIDDENTPADYCVDGSSLTMTVMDEGVEMTFVLTK